jgi:aldehyde dehydrogenase (NAD+)
MPQIFTKEFDTPVFKGKAEFNTGLFIDGKWVDGAEGKTIEYVILRDLISTSL